MKTCPFCREEINDDAIKCRFCQSMLVPVQGVEQRSSNDAQVTYILDRDLVRFGKFAAAVLAVFLVVGAFFFGFKLEDGLEKVRDAQERLSKMEHDFQGAGEKLRVAQNDLETAQVVVKNLKQEVETTLRKAKQHLNEISDQKYLAIATVSAMRELTPQQATKLPLAKVTQQDKVRPGSGAYWASGATLRIRFLDGGEDQKAVVKYAVAEWGKYANLRFEFVSSGDSELRVSFEEGEGSWSYRGTDALVVPSGEPTIKLGFVERSTALHEFGHALGLIEELMNPKANIQWEKELVYSGLGGAPYYWDRETIEFNLFRRIDEKQLGEYRDFDPKSVMTMSVPEAWTGGVALGGADGLSESDKALIARIYPRSP
jgi:hypothetical protein